MQPNKKKSVSVKDKLEGNELDLSLMELTEVPVKEMVWNFYYNHHQHNRVILCCAHLPNFPLFQAAVPRGTVVDLSNNSLVSLPVNFLLTHYFLLSPVTSFADDISDPGPHSET